MEDRTKLQKKLHAELGMNRSLNDPLEKAVLDEEGEPTEHCIYTMWDETTTFNTSVPGEKLKYLQVRVFEMICFGRHHGNIDACSILTCTSTFLWELFFFFFSPFSSLSSLLSTTFSFLTVASRRFGKSNQRCD